MIHTLSVYHCSMSFRMGKIYSSREVIQWLKEDGWYQVRVTGSHYHFKHTEKSGVVTIPHPKKQMGKGLLNSVLKQAKLKER
jgi:predicted RNA binding protein YcfA (HicA-like mRNA interferase family)